MRGNELLDKMELADPKYVEAADTKKKTGKSVWLKWGVLAASLCLVIISAFALPRLQSEPPAPNPDPDASAVRIPEPESYPPAEIEKDVQLDEPREIGAIIFNEVTAAIAASRQYIPGYFTEQLSEQELAALEPSRMAPDMVMTGYAGFDSEGNTLEAVIEVTAPFLDGPVAVRISKDVMLRDYELSGEPVICTYNEVDVTAYRWSFDETATLLAADAEINGYCFAFDYETTKDALGDAERGFEVILDCFTSYNEGRPDLSVVTPEAIPEFIDQNLTLSEAQSDADFGELMLHALPDGFQMESVRRYKDQNNDELSGLWTRGYDEIDWRICRFDENAQERVTSAADTRNYDLNLYPIPRSTSVPDELRNIVSHPVFIAEELTLDVIMRRAYKTEDAGDSDGWRMEFGVKYGDYVIEIRTKGVEPEWVYQQLTALWNH